MTVAKYFTKLKELWDDLGEHQQIPSCACLKDFNFSKFQEAEKVHKFLMGLDQNQFWALDKSKQGLFHGVQRRKATEDHPHRRSKVWRSSLQSISHQIESQDKTKVHALPKTRAWLKLMLWTHQLPSKLGKSAIESWPISTESGAESIAHRN